MRTVWPERLPLTARFGVIEYDGRDEQTVAESIDLVRRLRAGGLDLLNVSVGFVIPDAQVPWGTPAFLAPVAERVRREAGLPVASSWGIDDPKAAERVVASGQMDLVMIGRAHLANPHYPREIARPWAWRSRATCCRRPTPTGSSAGTARAWRRSGRRNPHRRREVAAQGWNPGCCSPRSSPAAPQGPRQAENRLRRPQRPAADRRAGA